MKTIMDAVNELKGDLGNLRNPAGSSVDNRVSLFKFVDDTGIYATLSNSFKLKGNDGCEYICLISDFKQLVNELSHAQWIKGASLEEYQAADKEVLKVENKTVEVDGMVYEIGKLYMFSDKSGNSEIGELSLANDINDGNGLMYQSKVSLRNSNKYEWWHSISAIKSDIGTITPAPIKLVDGAAYEFNYNNGSTGMQGAVMRYNQHGNHFFFDNTVFKLKHCTNITRLVPEAK